MDFLQERGLLERFYALGEAEAERISDEFKNQLNLNRCPLCHAIKKTPRARLCLKCDVIQQTGGLRKVRWSAQGKGKRGGVRVIYYYVTSASQIRLLLIYKKGIQDDLTQDQKKLLRQLNERW